MVAGEEGEVSLLEEWQGGRIRVLKGTGEFHEGPQIGFSVRRDEPEVSARLENAVRFEEMFPRVGDMLEKVLLHDEIERLVREAGFIQGCASSVESVAFPSEEHGERRDIDTHGRPGRESLEGFDEESEGAADIEEASAGRQSPKPPRQEVGIALAALLLPGVIPESNLGRGVKVLAGVERCKLLA